MKFKWKNNTCSEKALYLIENAVRDVENMIMSTTSEAVMKDAKSPEQPHIPTVLNDRLFASSLAVAIAPNVGEGCCFRGMHVAQFELVGKVYNIAILLRPEDN
eukprot:GHVR01148048.1.p1 GENE.GHVR01148048.1~~GHVR01148048.1.p1  ORF type:complete len:103 (+),score=26.57 GHVR01148048.1:792-1100(+)